MQEVRIFILTTITTINLSAFTDFGLANTRKSEGKATRPVFRKLIPNALGTRPLIPSDAKESIRFRVDNNYNVGIVVGAVTPRGTEYYSYGKIASHRDTLGNSEMAKKLLGIIDNHSGNNTDKVKRQG